MNKENSKSKKLSGTVVSNKMKDTAVVSVSSFKKHAKYGKFIKRHQKFKVHDPGNTLQVGDEVSIMETRPISKDKHFKII